jgi:DNA-directed RNA polymerase specialized sigma24 family protein
VDEELELFAAASGRRLLATAALLTQHRQQAEDLVQVTLERRWTSWQEIHTNPEAFARRVMVNTYLSWWRRRRRPLPRETLMVLAYVPWGAG